MAEKSARILLVCKRFFLTKMPPYLAANAITIANSGLRSFDHSGVFSRSSGRIAGIRRSVRLSCCFTSGVTRQRREWREFTCLAAGGVRRENFEDTFFRKGFIRIKLFFTYCFIRLIKFYQQFVSLRLTPSCRYHPSCSSYFIQAIRHFGLLKGSGRGFLRILRCNPFSLGGYDSVIGDKNNE